MIRAPIGQLIKQVPEKPEGTISLVRAIRNPKLTVKTYHFTPNIKAYAEEIIHKVASGMGGGYWAQAEYGAGKTHFLAAITCLLCDTSKDLWDLVRDEEIKSLRHRLEGLKLFPIVLTLKGMAQPEGEDNLLKVIEEVLEEAIEKANLQNKVKVTLDDEFIDWYEKREPSLKGLIDNFIKHQSGKDISRLERGETARLIRGYCKLNNIQPEVSTSTKDRISHVYFQIKDCGYDGLLFVIDEFEAWQRRHPIDSPAYAYDEEVLETLSWILPKDQGLKVYTIVASQKEAPAKLRGEEGDRFNNVILLRDERDYDVIVADRVRVIVPEKEPEIEEYYQFYYKDFRFLKNVSKEYFYAAFPFQPRAFEIIRRITARELPTARLGISVIYDVIGHQDILSRNSLIMASDLMQSPDFLDAMNTEFYRDAYNSYQNAISGLDDYDLDKDDREIAKRIIQTLFLWYTAYLETPRAMSVSDLTEVTLTTSDIVSGEDNVLRVLNTIRDLPQVYYTKEKGAIFKIAAKEIRPAQTFGTIKRKIKDEHRIRKKWEEGLMLSLQDTEGIGEGLFRDLAFGVPKNTSVIYKKLEYPGQVILAEGWRDEWGEKLDDIHFRVIFLTRNISPDNINLLDDRIAVCIPAELTNAAFETAWDFLTVLKMEEDYAYQNGAEAEETREWLKTKKRDVINNLISRQLPSYKEGKIYTKKDIGIDPKKVFPLPNIEKILEQVVKDLLTSAYTQSLINISLFKRKFTPREAKQVFEGLFKKSSTSAARSACENFAIGLALAKVDNPIEFNPEANKVFEFLKGKIESEKEIPAWKLYRDLQGTYGLTKEIITLELLAFICHRTPPCEIGLKPMNKLSIPGNRITAFNIGDIDWRPRLEDNFDTLSLSSEVPWDQVLPVARIINPNLKMVTRPDDIKEQEGHLVQAAQEIRGRIPKIKEGLKILCGTFDEDIDEVSITSLKNIEKLFNFNNYQEFYDIYQGQYGEVETLKSDFLNYQRLSELFNQSTELLNLKRYLADAYLPAEDSLDMEKNLIEKQLSLATLSKNPSLFGSIKGQFEKFCQRYQISYQKHHRDYHKRLGELRELLKDAQGKLEAVYKLDKITEITFPKGPDLKKEYQKLFDEIRLCPTKDPIDVSVYPICQSCKLRLGTKPPEESVLSLIKDIDKLLDIKSKRLTQALTKQIIKQYGDDKLEQLVKVVAISDLSKFATILDDSLIAFINEILRKENIRTESYPILESLNRRYGLIEEEMVEEVTNAFKEELKKAFTEAKKKYGKKKIKISLR